MHQVGNYCIVGLLCLRHLYYTVTSFPVTFHFVVVLRHYTSPSLLLHFHLLVRGSSLLFSFLFRFFLFSIPHTCVPHTCVPFTVHHDINFETITNLIHKYLYSHNITILYMFRALLCSSSGSSHVYVQHLVPSLSEWP